MPFPSAPTFARVLPAVAVARVGRSLDYRNVQAFLRAARTPEGRGALHYVLDFQETGLIDSRGLAAVFSLYRAVAARGGSVSFARPSVAVTRVVQITRVYRVFRQFPTLEAALASVCAGDAPAAPVATAPTAVA